MAARYFILSIITLSFALTVSAQKRRVLFLQFNGKPVSTRDSADFIRIVSEPDSGSNLYNITEYYVNGTPRLLGKSISSEYVLLEGQSIRYYANGKRELVATYQTGRIKGKAYQYYPNGVLYRVIEPSDNGPLESNSQFYNVNQLQDSTGKTLLTNNEGYYINYQPDFRGMIEEGKLKKGVRDSIWKGSTVVEDSIITFTERYHNGKMVDGQSITTTGRTYKYTVRVVNPQFRVAEDAFGIYIASNLRYPQSASRSNIQGKVFVQFWVEKDGSLNQFKVLNDPGYGLGDEALHVVKSSPKWKPGSRYGIPVKVQFTVPINFGLSRVR